MKTMIMALALLLAAVSAKAASLNLGWDAVTTNADGTPITDLAGYRLFQSGSSMLSMTTAQAMTNGAIIKTTLPGTGLTTTVNNLTAGSQYFFRLAAYDTNGNQSGFNVNASGVGVEISTTIPSAPPANIFDVNRDGSVNVTDVQLAVNQALGVTACGTGNVNGDAACNVTDVQLVVNKALGI
jgi:hypothetical protein